MDDSDHIFTRIKRKRSRPNKDTDSSDTEKDSKKLCDARTSVSSKSLVLSEEADIAASVSSWSQVQGDPGSFNDEDSKQSNYQGVDIPARISSISQISRDEESLNVDQESERLHHQNITNEVSDTPAEIRREVPDCIPKEISASSNFRKFFDSRNTETTTAQTSAEDPNEPDVASIESNKELEASDTDTFFSEAPNADFSSDAILSEPQNIDFSEDTSSSRVSLPSNENSEEEECEEPVRRRVKKKSEKYSNRTNLKKKLKPIPQKLVTTHKLRTDEINQIQITMSTTEQSNETQSKTSEILKNYFDPGKMTYRVIRRANFVIETVRQEKVIVDLTKLMKLIKEEEAGEGYKATIDKKSLMRLILKLSRDGYIKFRKATLKSDAKEKCVCFICDPNIEDDHSVITSALEQSKMKFFIATKDLKLKDEPMLIEEKDLPSDSKNIVKYIDIPEVPTETPQQEIKYKYDRTVSKLYGLCPKFVRTRIMHELLYYLIYEENNHAPVKDRAEIEKLLQEWGVKDYTFENDNFSVMYHRELGWKMFVPPLPTHNGWPKGWTLICDVLLRLPLSIFLKCFSVPYVIPGVRYYLDHPVRRYFLVKNLPPKVRNGLMHGRKYIYSMYEIVLVLCHMGLLQFGPQKLKEKDQVFVYLNKRASLLNTVTSPPGYHQVGEQNYEKHSYVFRTINDVETYWYELWSISANTTLGARNSVTGQFIVLEQAHTKPALMEAAKPRLAEEVERYDTGDIPGDKRGAAGLDSALFAHLKRNWNWADLLTYPEKKPATNPVEVVVPEKVVKKDEEEKKIKPKKRIECALKSKKFRVKHVAQRKKIVRHVLPKKKPRSKRPMYDEKDKVCLKKMSKLRTDWTQIEDNVLLLCTVASIYLCPNRRRQTIEFTVMRDVLHKLVAYANDKTSRSCQRRISYIMKNIKTRRSVQMCLEEIRQCEFVIEKFGVLVKKYHGVAIPILTLNIAFLELVAYLNRRFSNKIPTSNKTIRELPDSIQDIKKIYDINSNSKKSLGVFKDVETVNDIHFDVVRSVIHCSMCCLKDKTSWAIQLFKIYQQYPEALLRSVIAKIRHDQMISVKKPFVKSHVYPSGCLPFSSPFRLSISYAYQLQSTKFHYDTFIESNLFLRSVLQWLQEYTSPGKDHRLGITISDNGTSVMLPDIIEKLNVKFIFEHPEQVIVLDPMITNDTAYDRIVKRYNEILKDPTKINFWEECSNTDNTESDDENFPDFDNNAQLKRMDLNSAMIRRSSTRIAFHMMRAEMCEGIDKTAAQHIHDYFVVNASKVFLEAPDDILTPNWKRPDLSEMQIETNVHKILEKIKLNAIVPKIPGCITTQEIRTYFPDLEITNHDFEFIEKIKCNIFQANEIGMTLQQLKEITPDSINVQLSLLVILELLQNLKIIFRVGTTTPRFVHFHHKTPWVVTTDKIVRLEKEKLSTKDLPTSKWKGKRLIKNLPEDELSEAEQKIKLLVAPWVRLDGSINRRVLDRWAGSVLSYIMEEPGITLQELTSRYDFIKPVEIMSLVEYLSMLKCVNLIKIRKPKVTLFSQEPDYNFEDANIMDDPKFILLEPVSDAVFKFAVFLGQKSYGTNFID